MKRRRRYRILSDYLPRRARRENVAKYPYFDSALPETERVEAMLSRMSLREKVHQLVGRGHLATPDNRRLGIPGLLAADG